MRAHYGYADGSGEYYIIIDTDRCDGCGACASACPKDIFEIITDDYDDL
jgi:ferredoxin